MATPLTKLAQYWRDDANNADLSLTLPQRDAMRKCADELQQSFAQFRSYERGQAVEDLRDALAAQQPTAIPRLANCGRYTATDNTGQHYYLNHANTWQAFQGQQPAPPSAPVEATITNPWTGEPRDYRDVNSDPGGVLCVEPGAPLEAASGPEGLTVKQAWWAGYRAGKGHPPETPRDAALAQAPASGEAVAPFGYCADFETGLYECSHKFYYLAPGKPVPEGCTPFYTTPPAPVPAVRVTDEMVRRASDACCVVINPRTGEKAWFAPETDDDIRRMLEAALGQEKA